MLTCTYTKRKDEPEMSFRIGLCDRNKGFAESFADYTAFNKSFDIRVIIFSDMARLEDFLQREKLDLVLTDDISKCECSGSIPKFGGVTVKLLVERKDTDNPYEIYRYQAGRKLCEAVLKGVKSERRRHNGERVCVYSPLGRSGKTEFAFSYALYNSPDCIYIGMEDYSGFTSSDTDILYLLKSRSSVLPKVVSEQLRITDGVSVLIPSTSYQDILNVSKTDIQLLSDTLSGMGRSCIYDFGTGSIGDMTILEAFDVIYMPVLGDRISNSKIENFEGLLRKRGLTEVFGKLCKIMVPKNREEILRMIEESL